MYSDKTGSIWAKLLYSGNVVVFGQSGCIRAKVVVFGKSGCIGAKDVVFRQGRCTRAKVVLFGHSDFI